MPPYQNQNGQQTPLDGPQSGGYTPPQAGGYPGLAQNAPSGPGFYQAPPQQPASAPQPGSYPAQPGVYPAQPGTYPPAQQSGAYPQQPSGYASPQSGRAAPMTIQGDSNPYSFFLDEPANKRRGAVNLNAGSGMAFKIALLFLGVAGLIVSMLMLYAFIFKPPDNSALLVSIAHDQQELIRISTLGTKNVDESRMQNFAYNANISLTSAQQELLAHLAKTGEKLDPKKLTLSQDAKSDQALKAAEAANTYDATFGRIMLNGLSSYDKRLQQAEAASTSRSEKALLTKQHNANTLLLKQLNAPVQ